jgi:capsular polysaccharide biosynthesis protein
MAEQIDLRSVASLARRRRALLAVVALLGTLVGIALVVVRPPLYTSTSKVLLPLDAALPNGERSSWDAGTQVSIAESDAVLGPASRAVSPPLSRREVSRLVNVTASTQDVITIVARGSSSDAAEALAQAVAESEVKYQAQATSSLSAAEQAGLRAQQESLRATLDTVGGQIDATQDRLAGEDPDSVTGRRDASALAQLTAQHTQIVLDINQLETRIQGGAGTSSARIIETASPAERPELLVWKVVAGLAMAFLFVLVALVGMVVSARRDPKLRTRDEISDAVGSPVIASLRTQVPHSVAAWRSLLETYNPRVAEGWNLRQALTLVGLGDLAMAGPDARPAEAPRARHLLCVVSLADDGRALSAGPQLATFAASIGVSTMLVPRQGDATAALWAVCSSQPGDEEVRPNLRVASRRRTKNAAELTVIVAALDRRAPTMPRLDRAAVVVLAVASGAATSEDLARAAVAAHESGLRIAGVMVADPDPLDKTTGRLLPHERLHQQPLPSRVTGPRPAALRDSSWTGGGS